MKCDVCFGDLVTRVGEHYKYTESGLENVYLVGHELETCIKCNETTVSIPRILDVHAAIGRAVALKPYPLNGDDVRFLRKQLGKRAKEWAKLVKADVATLSRWENNEQSIGLKSDALIRFLYYRLLEETEGCFYSGSLVSIIANLDTPLSNDLILTVDVTTLSVRWEESLGGVMHSSMIGGSEVCAGRISSSLQAIRGWAVASLTKVPDALANLAEVPAAA